MPRRPAIRPVPVQVTSDDSAHAQRRRLGAYVTPAPLVNLLLDHAIPRLLGRRLGLPERDLAPRIGALSAKRRKDLAARLLGVRVCDPACGPGPFLVAAARSLAEVLIACRKGRSDRAHRQARQDVARDCLLGADIDPRQTDDARDALSAWSGLSASELGDSLTTGDSLGLSTAAPAWAGNDPATIDLLVGNPPFVNAIERRNRRPMADPKRFRRLGFGDLTGTADLAYYFVAAAHRLTKPDGLVALIVPRAFLCSAGAARLRTRLLRERPPSLLVAPTDESLFADAQVHVAAVALGGESCLGGTDASSPAPIRVEDDNWWRPLVAPETPAPAENRPTIAERFGLRASMTVSMAYRLREFVAEAESPTESAPRLITTGLIDPNRLLWGERICRYLGARWQRPTIARESDLPADVRRRVEESRRPKILVAGLSDRLEACLDPDGRCCGSVGTYTITDPDDDRDRLGGLCRVLNSDRSTDRLRATLGATALGGGRITVTKRFLAELPI